MADDPNFKPTERPSALRRIAKGMVTMPWDVAVDLGQTTKSALFDFPMAVVQSVKQERLALKAYSEREKEIAEKTLFWWGMIVLLAVLCFFVIGGWANVLTLLLGFVWVCARFGWWDPVRDAVTKSVLRKDAGATEGAATTVVDQVLQEEISSYRLELVQRMIREWDKLPKTERAPKAPETILRVLDTLTRSYQASAEPPPPADPPSSNEESSHAPENQ